MTTVVFCGSTVVHAADKAFSPLCNQTNASKIENCQQVIDQQITCRRCLAVLEKLKAAEDPEPPSVPSESSVVQPSLP